jgi:hypothetical protein
VPDANLSGLWGRFLNVERQLDQAWARVAAHGSRVEPRELAMLSDAADAIGHEHDHIVRQIAAQPASTWQGVAIKLLTWRRTANVGEFNLPDAEVALAFSAYLDALRLSGVAGSPDDTAIARLAIRHPDMAGVDV